MSANPIALRSREGLLYAYACSTCHHVGISGSMFGREEATKPVDQLVRASLRSATQCCTCLSCGAFSVGQSTCERCAQWDRFVAGWINLSCPIDRGCKTQEEWDEWCRQADEEDDE